MNDDGKGRLVWAFCVAISLFGMAEGCRKGGPREVALTDDMEITQDIVVKKGLYTIEDKGSAGILIVKADNVTIDFDGAVLQGSAEEGAAPNTYAGTGILVEGRKGVVIKNAIIRHMLVGIHVDASSAVTIQACDVSNNFAQRLKKSDEGPCTGDHWLTQGFDPECWKTLGAGILLRDSDACVVSSCTGRFGQNGIMMIRAHDSQVYDNDMSFNSGWGLRLYGACKNRVSHNKFDYCVRCHHTDLSGDSAGILVQRGSCDNLFARNSATHGGDGFFLGSATESLKEGSDNNLVIENDFSYSPCNAIEATFSKGNKFIRNKCNYSGYGVWAGLSYENWFIENEIIGSGNDGIAIESGHDTVIEGNTIEHCGNGIRLWTSPDWVQREQAKSARYHILRNSISYSKRAGIDLSDTPDTEIVNNVLKRNAVGVNLQKSPRTQITRNNVVVTATLPGNLALRKQAAASVSNEAAGQAVDGDEEKGDDTAWGAAEGGPGAVTLRRGDWWQVDLGEEKELSGVVMRAHLPGKFRLELSSNGQFAGEERAVVVERERARVQNNIDSYLSEETGDVPFTRLLTSEGRIYAFPTTRARYVRFVCDEAKREGIWIKAFEVYPVPHLEREAVKGGMAIRHGGREALVAPSNYWGTTDDQQIKKLFSNPDAVETAERAKVPFSIGAIEHRVALSDVRGSLDVALSPEFPRGVRHIRVHQWYPVLPAVGKTGGLLSDNSLYCVVSQDEAGTVEIGRITIGGDNTEFHLEDVPKEMKIERARRSARSSLSIKWVAAEQLPLGLTEKSFRVSFPSLKKTETVHLRIVRMAFQARLWKWDPLMTPIKNRRAWEALFSEKPLWEGQLERIHYRWGMDVPTYTKGLPQRNYAMLLTATIEAASDGEWFFNAISDDGIRVKLDDAVTIENWSGHADAYDSAKVPVKKGTHTITIEYFQGDGTATLCFWIDTQASTEPPE